MVLASSRRSQPKASYLAFSKKAKSLDVHKIDPNTYRRRGVAGGERGVNTTLIVSADAVGHLVLSFKRKRMIAESGEGAPPACLPEILDTVLDGHTTHSKNLEAFNLAREHGVILHATHRLQPLDVAVFRPMEVCYIQAVERWLLECPGLAVTPHQVAKLLWEAYEKAATVGINPENSHSNKHVSFEEVNCLSGPGRSVDKREEPGHVQQHAAVGSMNTSFEELMRLLKMLNKQQ
nr:unnamed protein product [Callosobruchus analis]